MVFGRRLTDLVTSYNLPCRIPFPPPCLSLPASCPACPQIDGDWRYDMRKSSLVWSIELIDATNRTGSAEFVVPAAPAEAFFPIEVCVGVGVLY